MREESYINKLILIIIVALATIIFGVKDNAVDLNVNGSNRYSLNDPIKTLPEKEAVEHLHLTLLDEGIDVYDCGGRTGYRYGPSIIYYDDGTMDCFFSSPGNNIQWDYIRYRHFDGYDWSDDQIVLKPTIGSLDHYSTCDPGVIFFNGYYYLGYTSTSNPSEGGIFNCVFVARSQYPDGPYEKWNGNGWGGEPVPILVYDGTVENAWGVGEVSFVVNDEQLYCYYSYIDGPDREMLAIGDLSDNWPATLTEQGCVIEKRNGQDSLDFAYVDEYDKFMAISVEQRFTNLCSIAVYESEDGINFEKAENVRENLVAYAHNIGISKNIYGHIDVNQDLIIGYAYGPHSSWGRWNTRFHSINICEVKD